MVPRKIIFECRVGSHLYGTNTPESDEDFFGVFMPGSYDLFGLQNCPTEWTEDKKRAKAEKKNGVGDVDRKYFSIKRFLSLASQGQPGQLEMLFAPDSAIISKTEEWDYLRRRYKTVFMAKSAISPFLGFAASQAHKATIKGENLALIRKLIGALEITLVRRSRAKISDLISDIDGNKCLLLQQKVDYFVNDYGHAMIRIAGRQFDVGLLASGMFASLNQLCDRYGKRSDAAAESGYDFKSLSHAVRLVSEAEEYLLTGLITLPRPDAAFLLEVRRGFVDRDWHQFLQAEIERIKTDVMPHSLLPDATVFENVNSLCIDMITRDFRH